jgi:hypothetical protein
MGQGEVRRSGKPEDELRVGLEDVASNKEQEE